MPKWTIHSMLIWVFISCNICWLTIMAIKDFTCKSMGIQKIFFFCFKITHCASNNFRMISVHVHFHSMFIWAPFQLITSFKWMLKHVFLQICTISIFITTKFTLVWAKVFIIFGMFSANMWLQTITRSCLIITKGAFKFQNWGFIYIYTRYSPENKEVLFPRQFLKMGQNWPK